VERNAKSYDLKRIQTDGEKLIFVEQLTEKDRFHLSSLLLDMQIAEVITREMMPHSEHTLPSVTCMLLMLCITSLHVCMLKLFFSNCPTAFTQTKRDAAVEELIKQLNQDPSRIWNGVELHKQYEDFSAKVLSRRLLINYLRVTLHPDTQTCWCYPHQVWHLLLCSEARHLLHFTL